MREAIRTASLAEKDRAYLAEKFREAGVVCAQSLPFSAQAYLCWAIWDTFGQPVIWVGDSPRSLEIFAQDLGSLRAGSESRIARFPARESLPGGSSSAEPERIGDRLQALQSCLSRPGPAVLATCVQALLQPTLAPSAFQRFSQELAQAREYELDRLVENFARAGYEFQAEVQAKGQASLRGGLLDIWPPAEAWPLRIEFFGNAVESIRSFDPVEQKSLEHFPSVFITLPDDTQAVPDHGPARAHLTDYLAPETRWIWSEPESIRHHAELFRETQPPGAAPEAGVLLDYPALRAVATDRFTGGQVMLGEDKDQPQPAHELDLRPGETLPALSGGILHPDLLADAREKFLARLGDRAATGWRIYLYFTTEGARDRFLETHRSDPLTGRFSIELGALSEGFFSESMKLWFVAESDLFGRARGIEAMSPTRRRRIVQAAGTQLVEWTDIQPGDLVVHVDHGIGKYLGLYEIRFHDQTQEVLTIEYAEKSRLYVPVAQAHLLSRYVGLGRRRPPLHALGGKKWPREKVAAERAIRDLSASLLETQAAREALGGHAFPPDTAWQHEFEATFPYPETPDQDRAIREVKQDMESARPMDRVVCGDVGYGKTEVALRACFKAVMDGKQVAVLVPTTILAQQHYDTFTSRLQAFPIAVDMLSRFQTSGEQDRIVERVRAGETDIVIGTHRLIQDDVQFHDLGLLVIDEEQRFGVEQKEFFKQFRKMVDVLTLTATPIPRTLYMSLTGARDMSTIQTPPQERLPIETFVMQYQDPVVREAILRELNRDGQVFYLHNRVRTIERVRQRLATLAPEARIELAHGQMPEHELATVMRRFVRREFDVLLCTTIIESGVDIPNVNTIVIESADRFGLADLYQLRGRVGRYKHKAYAYLLLPRHGQLFEAARKRIGAIRRYSSLGAGFKLALRDLEIRGAGNLLGAEQSGHITAVGFDLYCQLLKRSVAQLKGEPLPPIIDVEVKLDFIDLAIATSDQENAAVIPGAYIEDESVRVRMYRKIASTATGKELDDLQSELRDRFGPIPNSARRLLMIARLRIAAAERRIQRIEVDGDKVMLSRDNDYLTTNQHFPRLKSAAATERLEELIRIVQRY